MKGLDSVIQVDTVKINRELINSLPKVFELYIQEFVNSEIILKDKMKKPTKEEIGVVEISKTLIGDAKELQGYISDKLNKQHIKEIEKETLKGVGFK